MTLGYIERPDNFLNGIRRSIESGVTPIWTSLREQLTGLFYQTYRDGLAEGAQTAVYKQQENEMMRSALTRLLEMGADQARRNAAGEKLTVLKSLEIELITSFMEVVKDSFDVSDRKMQRLVDKYTKSLNELTERLEKEEVES